MIRIERENSIEIIPEEGKVLFDGDTYTTAASIPSGVDISVWVEVDSETVDVFDYILE